MKCLFWGSLIRKVLFIISCLLFNTVFSTFDEVPDESRSIGIIVLEKWRGEREFAERIRIACEKLGWKAKIYFAEKFNEKKLVHDWILTLVPVKNSCQRNANYLVLFAPELHFFERSGHLKKVYQNYSGYLSTYSNTDLLLEDIGGESQNLYPKPWYPSVQHRKYQRVEPGFLYYSICHWGNRAKDEKYKTMERLLSQTSYAKLFGNPKFGKKYGAAFQGEIPFDGESVLSRITELGVCLVLHSDTHIKHEIPSGRIFEAASASAVIISDLNPFVVKHFGDTVLYVDQELSGEELFRQIDGHMEWIRHHQEEALQMAERAYQIFEDNFVLENQLLEFDQFIR